MRAPGVPGGERHGVVGGVDEAHLDNAVRSARPACRSPVPGRMPQRRRRRECCGPARRSPLRPEGSGPDRPCSRRSCSRRRPGSVRRRASRRGRVEEVAEVGDDVFGRGRADRTEPIRRRCGDGHAGRADHLACHRMRRNAQPDGVAPTRNSRRATGRNGARSASADPASPQRRGVAPTPDASGAHTSRSSGSARCTISG